MLGTWLFYWNRFWAWRRHDRVGPWVYHRNEYTGERLAVYVGPGYQPVDRAWLKAGTSYTIIGGSNELA